MRKFRTLSFGMKLLIPAVVVSLIMFAVVSGISKSMADDLLPQKMAYRWKSDGGFAQISCFFSVNANVTQDIIEEFEHKLDSALEEASIVVESPNASARLWVDAYSATGKINVKSNIGNVTVNAIGIGGDFFQFHPMQLMSGSYFSGNDLMQDYCVLDEEAAWKLFGSNDVAGQIVFIGDVAHVVTGVVKTEEGKLYKKAGLDGSHIFVSYDTLHKYGIDNGISHFEIVMPNPVKQYALNYVKDAIGIEETEVEIVENSKRFSFLNRLLHIKELPVRSMNGKAIIYPYWENVARAYEDILAVTMLLELMLIGFPIVVLMISCIVYWKRKEWRIKDILLHVRDYLATIISENRKKRKFQRKMRRRSEE